MRQYFTPQELVEHFTLLPHEQGLLAHKSGIRQWWGFRPGTTTDAETLTAWVCAHTRVDDATLP